LTELRHRALHVIDTWSSATGSSPTPFSWYWYLFPGFGFRVSFFSSLSHPHFFRCYFHHRILSNSFQLVLVHVARCRVSRQYFFPTFFLFICSLCYFQCSFLFSCFIGFGFLGAGVLGFWSRGFVFPSFNLAVSGSGISGVGFWYFGADRRRVG